MGSSQGAWHQGPLNVLCHDDDDDDDDDDDEQGGPGTKRPIKSLRLLP